MAGGGQASEAKEDKLDKGKYNILYPNLITNLDRSDNITIGIDWVQEHVLGQGPQNNESAAEQFKDEQISDFIRGQYKGVAGSELPVRDK